MNTLVSPETYLLPPTAEIPNSPYPLLHYRSVFPPPVRAETISRHFDHNSWPAQWQSNMYHQSHYHSTTHEALGITRGSARLRFGVSDSEASDERRVELDVDQGDVLVIPAGVAHRCLIERDGFNMVGAYPRGSRQWDLCYGGEHKAGKGIEDGVPETDPVVGREEGGLTGLWMTEVRDE
ncbi:hypothetical protein RUND412_004374 [Rhizina undulata]